MAPEALVAPVWKRQISLPVAASMAIR